MKGILKVFLLLVTIFSTSFLLNLHYQWMTVDSVRAILDQLQASPRAGLWIALVVFALLSIDSVLAVPTITTIVLAGYFLGPVSGGTASALGVMMAGSICFWGTRFGGERVLRWIVNEEEARRLGRWFQSSGGLALLLSRSLPMLPEVLSCLAGMSRMRAGRYFLLFALGNVPFAYLAAFAGSQSSLEKPWPALIVGMGVPAVAYLVWLFFVRRRRPGPDGTPGLRAGEETMELRLEITGVETDRPGRLYVYLFGAEGFPKRHGRARESFVLEIRGARGVYPVQTHLTGAVAIKVVHDEADSGAMRKRFGFLPGFGVGYSRGARITYRVPRFAEAALRLEAGVRELRVPIRMQYLLAPRTSGGSETFEATRAGRGNHALQ